MAASSKGTTSEESGYATSLTRRRLSGMKHTRPMFFSSSFFMSLAAVSSLSTTTLNSEFPAATFMSTERRTRMSSLLAW